VTLLKIAQIGHPVLRERAREVSREELLDPEMQQFIDDLVETMRDASGAGLAAIQVHRAVRIVAIEVKDNPRYPYKPNIPLTVVVNPVLTPLSEERFDNYEGCLSVPNLRGLVERYAEVKITGMERDGRPSSASRAGSPRAPFSTSAITSTACSSSIASKIRRASRPGPSSSATTGRPSWRRSSPS
jgi:peptide deformylase